MMKRKKLHQHIQPAFALILSAAGTFVVLYTMLATAISPERYDLRVGEVAPITITATKDVEDTVTTQLLKDQALLAVKPSYKSDDSVAPTVLLNIEAAFQQLTTLRATDPNAGVSADDVAHAQEIMAPVEMNLAALQAVMGSSEEMMNSLSLDTRVLVQGVLDDSLSEAQRAQAVQAVEGGLIAEGYSEELAKVAGGVVSAYLLPNLLLDEEATEASRQKAIDSVEPVVYKMGQNIVRAGEVITRSQYEVLNSLGMIKDRSVDLMLYLGVALLLALVMGMLVVYLNLFERELFMNVRMMVLLMFIVVITVASSMLIQPLHTYLMPVTLGVMLVTILIKPRVALIVNVALSVLTGLVASESGGVFTTAMFCVMLTSIVSGSVCVAVIGRRQLRTSVILAGLMVAVSNALTAYAVGLINNANTSVVIIWSLWAAGSGILSAVLCIGLQPALEWMFNLVTSAKLIELSNPNQPLIRRLLLEAPGTYHHSIIVANLSEAAANAIGANGLLARVGAYYHDVGKLKRPLYFKENQMGDNPHDRTDPMVSTAILTAHPRDGVQMAIRHRIPQPILDIMAQHHGDTPVMYFYDRAVKQNGGAPVDVADFRYDGVKPQTAEAAVVMLADTVEAAARAMPDPNREKVERLIEKLIQDKMEDGQLDDSPLSFRDLFRIRQAFITVLTGVYHGRIEYPAVDLPAKKMHTIAGPRPATEASPSAEGKPLSEPKPPAEPKPTAESKPQPEARPAAAPRPAESKPATESRPQPVARPVENGVKGNGHG